MALDRANLIKLAKLAASADSKSTVAYSFGEDKFSAQDLNETLRAELKELCGTYALYRENKNTVFALIEETIDDVLPKKVMEQFGQFAEIKQFNQGDKAVFTQKITEASRRRAKQFVTKVGLAGQYEVFKLDGKAIEVEMTAIGGAAQIGFEEFLDGRIDFADVTGIIAEAMDEFIYAEIEKALIACIADLPANNKVTGATSFVETNFDKLLSVADSYGQSTIYCTFEFAATMLPTNTWGTGYSVADRISENMKDELWKNGHFSVYKNHRVIILEQSLVDANNAQKVIDPSYCWIIPSGNAKPVKIAFEGQTAVREQENADWSREIQTYKKFGVATLVTNNMCVYRNTSLTKTV